MIGDSAASTGVLKSTRVCERKRETSLPRERHAMRAHCPGHFLQHLPSSFGESGGFSRSPAHPTWVRRLINRPLCFCPYARATSSPRRPGPKVRMLFGYARPRTTTSILTFSGTADGRPHRIFDDKASADGACSPNESTFCPPALRVLVFQFRFSKRLVRSYGVLSAS
jgi:hypothetical protein